MEPSQPKEILRSVSEALHIPQDAFIREGMRAVVERELRRIQMSIFEIQSRYGVSSSADMESLYEEGQIEEESSWQDWHRLDHLEYEQERLIELLDTLS